MVEIEEENRKHLPQWKGQIKAAWAVCESEKACMRTRVLIWGYHGKRVASCLGGERTF